MQIFFIMAPFTTIHLPQWDGGTQKIRFIYLTNATSFKLTSPLEVSMLIVVKFIELTRNY